MKITVIPALVASAVLSLAAQGRDYYVSTDGSNANPGTLASPLRNIQTAINAAVAGDTIYVRGLTSAQKQAVYSERLSITRSGTLTGPIAVRNYAEDVNGDGSPAYPAVDQTGMVPPADVSALLSITDCDYITVSGLELRNYETSNQSSTPAGIYVSGKGKGIHLDHNKVHHIYQSNATLNNANANGFGIAVYGSNATTAIDSLVLDSNEIYDLRTGQSESVTLNGNVTNFQVTNNSVHDCNNIGIDCIGFEQSLPDAVNYARNGTVRGNLVYNIDSQFNPGYGGNFNGTFSSQAARDATRSAPGIYVDGGASITVERNHVHHCNVGMSFSSEHFGRNTVACLVRDNLIRASHVAGLFLGGASSGNGGTKDCSLTNNTFYQNDTEGVGGGSIGIQYHVTGTTIRQNLFVCAPVPPNPPPFFNPQFILYTATDGTFSTNAIDWNLYSGTAIDNLEFDWLGASYGSFADWKSGSSQDGHSLFVPGSSSLFAVAAPANNTDFVLAANSPALNAGDPSFAAASGETDYFGLSRVAGGRVDIGMVEGGAPVAQIRVEQPSGTVLASGTSNISFGFVTLPGSDVETFVVRNVGAAPLTGLGLSVDGVNAAEFSAGALSTPPPLAPGASTTFNVTFTPVIEGSRTASLHITSNAADVPSFTVMLSGVGQVAPAITTQPIPKTVNPGTAVTFTVVATGTKPLTYQWRKDTHNISGATGASYTLAKAAETDQGGYDVVVTNPASSVISDAVQLSVNDPVTFAVPLASQSANVGSTVTFSVAPAGTPPLSYQWRKNGINIAGATTSSYVIPSVSLASSATYSVWVKNIVGAVVSANAVLSVVDATTKMYTLPSGGKAVMPAAFAGLFTSYAWTKDSNALPADPRYVGGATKTLSISGLRVLSPNDSGTYQCTGTAASGNLTATAVLLVYSSPPLITTASLTLPTAIVGGAYSAPHVPFDPSPDKIPTVFSAIGLPSGITINSTTGNLSGKPVVALTADHSYPVKLTVANAKGSVSITTALLVKALPYGTVGSFSGPVVRDPALNKNLGGRVDLAVASNGSYSGKVTLGVLAYSLTGSLVTDVTGNTKPHGSSIINRTAPLPSLTLSFDVDSANHLLINGQITDGAATATFSGWRNKWGATTPAAELSALKAFSGYYTFGMTIPSGQVGVDSVPQGMSYGMFTLTTAGTLAVSGRMADGTAFACSTFGGPHGEVLLYQALYSSLGSVLGTLQLTVVGSGPTYPGNTLAGNADWLRPAVSTVHLYKAGFGPLALTATGSRYVAPKSLAILMGLPNNGTNANARLDFAQGGISDTLTPPGIDLNISSAGAIIREAPNTDLTTLAFNAVNGAISGTFRLIDSNPAVPGGASITRTSSYYGVIANGANGWQGGGYFLLAKRPQMLPQTIATTDVLSGMVTLKSK